MHLHSRYNLQSSNNVPSDITLSSIAYNEDVPTGTHVASLTAIDQDNNDTHTFTLASGNGTNDADNNHFTIQGASLKTSGTFDFETKSSYNIYVNTNDGSSNYAKAFTLTVSDVNEAPTGITASSGIGYRLPHCSWRWWRRLRRRWRRWCFTSLKLFLEYG